MKRVRGWSAGVLLIASGLLAVGQAPTQATPPPLECAITFSYVTPLAIGVNTSATAQIVVDFMPAEATIVDLDVVVATSGSVSANDLRMTVLDPGPDPYNTTLFAQGSGLASDFTNTRFNDESANGLLSAATDPILGDYQSLVPLSGWDGATVNRTYRLDISNYSTTVGGSLDHFSVVLTISGCPDADNDGVTDWADNCPSDANSDQTDTDDDATGDACDTDDDNDTVLDASDNCPLVINSAQSNLDLDTFGDECDGDVDGDEVANEFDECEVLFGATESGCPADDRTVTLKYSKGAFRGQLGGTSLGACLSGVPVKVLKVRSGSDRLLGTVSSKSSGKFVFKTPRKVGKYYAVADSVLVMELAECVTEQSPTLTLK